MKVGTHLILNGRYSQLSSFAVHFSFIRNYKDTANLTEKQVNLWKKWNWAVYIIHRTKSMCIQAKVQWKDVKQAGFWGGGGGDASLAKTNAILQYLIVFKWGTREQFS